MNISLILESFLAKVNMEKLLALVAWILFWERDRGRFVLNLHNHYEPAVQDEQFAITLQGMYKRAYLPVLTSYPNTAQKTPGQKS